ncbi:MAG: phosphopantothenoylcysteine decarboxylase / phosphopantothenate---cysteine ligase [Actinomycetota bacterium]|nr:phosphopantothenoylcysteine decarboxylase / phosphopantothenate---cysteine ligase [Actinomycetota bacterium]
MPRVVLGVCGGIAAYKAVEVCRRLVDAGIHVAPVLTDGAREFVGAVTFSALASEPARTSLFGGPEPIPHTYLGQTADLVVVAPATAKLLGKYAAGISDDLLTATLLATRAPVLVCPAMHTEMWEHPAVQENLATLRRRGVHVLDPEQGRLAGGDVGAGRLAEPARIADEVLRLLTGEHPLTGRTIVVTAGGTREAVDPVRYVGNRSSGKMGHALANVALRLGARVVLITTANQPVAAGVEVVAVESAQEMHDAVMALSASADAVIMAAAVADFRPKAPAQQKIKKADGVPEIVFEPTTDILAALGRAKRPGQIVVGFAAETERLRENAAAKLAAKRVDLIVANDVSASDAGFEVDTNRALLLAADGSAAETQLLTKDELATVVLARVAAYLGGPLAGPST